MATDTTGAVPSPLTSAVTPAATGDATRTRKRTHSPPYPPFVETYAPYARGQLQACRVGRTADLCKKQWDLYYRNNTVNGYKDRHYILREFHELRAAIDAAVAAEAGVNASADTAAASAFSWMEAGCGVGNAMLPVFVEYGHLRHWRALLGFDISSVAIGLLQKKRAQLPPDLAAKVHVCVLNPTETDVTDCTFFASPPIAPDGLTDTARPTWMVPPALSPSPPGGEEGGRHACTAAEAMPCAKPEFVSMIFVLCSIPVSAHSLVLRRIASSMSPTGGWLYFRDYGVQDQAEQRFQATLLRRRTGVDGEAKENTYERTNGTLSHFFSLEEVRSLFEDAGFHVVALDILETEVVNRKTGVSFARRFVQGRFHLRPC